MSEQPTPYAGQQSVTRALMDLLAERERKGIETYGRSLETFNGRDAPRDLVEELIDGAQYALQWQMERAELIRQLQEAREHRRILREALEIARAVTVKLTVSGEESLGQLQQIIHRLGNSRTRAGVAPIERQEAVYSWLNATSDADFVLDRIADTLAATEATK